MGNNATQATRPPPPGWPRISSAVYYEDAAAAIDWLCRAFGFEVQLKVEGDGGEIVHSQLTFGDGLIMVSGETDQHANPIRSRSPRSVDGVNTQVLAVFVDDVDAHCAHAREAGAVIVNEPKTDDYGEDYWADRSYRARDPEGHNWWFMQRVRGPGADER
ncbi:MAG: VOC family protein [Sandaracinaceae bacterium]